MKSYFFYNIPGHYYFFYMCVCVWPGNKRSTGTVTQRPHLSLSFDWLDISYKIQKDKGVTVQSSNEKKDKWRWDCRSNSLR